MLRGSLRAGQSFYRLIRSVESRSSARRDRAPRLPGAGFVTGYWLRSKDDHGLSVLVFESEDAAQAMAQQVEGPPTDAVTLDSVEVREVAAHA